jgi:hypothetical protein
MLIARHRVLCCGQGKDVCTEMDELVSEAWRAATPKSRLRELADQDPRLARIVASRIGLSAKLAEELAVRASGAGGSDSAEGTAQGDVRVLRALAAQPATSPQRLTLLAQHADEQVRRSVALHRSTPKPALRVLLGDASAEVRRALAAREKLPRKIAAALLTDASADVRLALARRFEANPDHLRALARDPDPRIRRVVAALGHADGADLSDDDVRTRRIAVDRCGLEELAPHLDRLVRDPDAGVRQLCAYMRHNHSPAPLAVLAADPVPTVREYAAMNWYTPAEALAALAGDTDLRVLERISDNPFTPPQALAAVVEAVPSDLDGSSPSPMRSIISQLLDHPAIPPEALRALYAKNPPYFHMNDAMGQSNWPPDLVIEFALSYSAPVEGEEELRSYAEIDAARRSEPLDQVLATMLSSPIHCARRAAAANRHTPPQALAEYVRTADPEREEYGLDGVARNPSTPVEILNAWAAAGERHYELLKNPYLAASVLEAIAADDSTEYASQARRILEVRGYRAGTEETC